MNYWQRLRQELLPTRDAFDRRFNVSTSGFASLCRLRIASKNKGNGFRYEAVDPKIFKDAIQYVPKSLPFVDLGCGKGRALILAHEYGFSRIIGVEFSQALASVARKNLAALGIPAIVIEGDAVNFAFPVEPCAVFMYNPFNEAVLRRIQFPARSYIVYVNPRARFVLSEFQVVHERGSFIVFYCQN